MVPGSQTLSQEEKQQEEKRVPGPQLIWSPAPRATQFLGRRLRDHAGDLPYRGVVGEGALVLVDAVPRPGHADRGHVRHQ